MVLADGEELTVNEFPQIAAQVDGHDHAPMIETSPAMSPEPEPEPMLLRSAPSLRLTDLQGEVRPLEEIESETIRFAIAHYRGQMSEVARRLKIGRSTLYRKLEALALDENDAGPDQRQGADAG